MAHNAELHSLAEAASSELLMPWVELIESKVPPPLKPFQG